MAGNKRTTVFLDRDGTININLPFPNVNAPEKLRLLPRAAEAVRLLNDAGHRVVVITNQAGINNPENDLNEEMFARVTERLDVLLKEGSGAHVDDTFCCPHTREEKCPCRKPGTDLYETAMEKYTDMAPGECYVVGDREDDILAGNALGMRTILVLTGHGASTYQRLSELGARADHVAGDLYDAALIIKGDTT